jgi:hypothetical protein
MAPADAFLCIKPVPDVLKIKPDTHYNHECTILCLKIDPPEVIDEQVNRLFDLPYQL